MPQLDLSKLWTYGTVNGLSGFLYWVESLEIFWILLGPLLLHFCLLIWSIWDSPDNERAIVSMTVLDATIIFCKLLSISIPIVIMSSIKTSPLQASDSRIVTLHPFDWRNGIDSCSSLAMGTLYFWYEKKLSESQLSSSNKPFIVSVKNIWQEAKIWWTRRSAKR